MRNVLWDELPDDVRMIYGNRKPFSMAEGIDGTFDAAFFTGYHAAVGDARRRARPHLHLRDALRDARQRQALQRSDAQRRRAGHARRAGRADHRRPGRRSSTRKAEMPWITGVVVKDSIGRFATNSISPAAAREADPRRSADGDRAARRSAAVPLRAADHARARFRVDAKRRLRRADPGLRAHRRAHASASSTTTTARSSAPTSPPSGWAPRRTRTSEPRASAFRASAARSAMRPRARCCPARRDAPASRRSIADRAPSRPARSSSALLPIENSISGPIARTYDLLWEHPRSARRRRDRVIRVEMNADRLPGRRRVQHPRSPLASGRARTSAAGFSRASGSGPRRRSADTAGAVREIVAVGDPAVAAIGPAHRGRALRRAACCAAAIQDDPRQLHALLSASPPIRRAPRAAARLRRARIRRSPGIAARCALGVRRPRHQPALARLAARSQNAVSLSVLRRDRERRRV